MIFTTVNPNTMCIKISISTADFLGSVMSKHTFKIAINQAGLQINLFHVAEKLLDMNDHQLCLYQKAMKRKVFFIRCNKIGVIFKYTLCWIFSRRKNYHLIDVKFKLPVLKFHECSVYYKMTFDLF